MNAPNTWFEELPSNRLLAEISLWSADLTNLEADLRRIEPFTDVFHIDVSDGHFAPALLFFPDLVARLRKLTAKPFHVHLMTKDEILEPQIAQFAEAGADLISIHAENANAAAGIAAIAALGLKSGLVLELETSVEAAKAYLGQISWLTLLGTKIGIKGVGLDPQALGRLSHARILTGALDRRVIVANDGGNRENTLPLLRKAGAETVVMGSLAFGAPDLRQRMAWVAQL